MVIVSLQFPLPEFAACPNCGLVWPRSGFYIDKRYPDYWGKCRACRGGGNKRTSTLGGRYCADCRVWFPTSGFAPDRRARDGCQSYCRECMAKRIKRSYDLYAENRRKAARAWRETYPERQRAAKQRWEAQNRDKKRAMDRRYRLRNLARIRIADRARLYKRRARLAAAKGSATPEQIRLRWEFYGGRCWICGARATTPGHVIALAAGGSNWPANLRPACLPCNSSKRDRNWRSFV